MDEQLQSQRCLGCRMTVYGPSTHHLLNTSHKKLLPQCCGQPLLSCSGYRKEGYLHEQRLSYTQVPFQVVSLSEVNLKSQLFCNHSVHPPLTGFRVLAGPRIPIAKSPSFVYPEELLAMVCPSLRCSDSVSLEIPDHISSLHKNLTFHHDI